MPFLHLSSTKQIPGANIYIYSVVPPMLTMCTDPQNRD